MVERGDGLGVTLNTVVELLMRSLDCDFAVQTPRPGSETISQGPSRVPVARDMRYQFYLACPRHAG